MKLPRLSVFLSLGGDENKQRFLESARRLHALGLHLYCTRLTSAFLTAHDVPNTRIYKVHEQGTPNIIDYLRERRIDLLINVTDEYVSEQFEDDYRIRRAADRLQRALADQPTGRAPVRRRHRPLPRRRPAAAPWDEYVTMKAIKTAPAPSAP